MLFMFWQTASSQLLNTRTGFIGFYSKTPLEDIKAENNQAYAIMDLAKNQIAFVVLVKGFIFPKELMQEHFNENYIESDKYPKASFSGNFTGNLSPSQDGVYKIIVKGNLNLHNVSKTIELPATLEVKGNTLIGEANFTLKPEDYNISIPGVVRDKIAREITVHVRFECNPSK
jgi:hypothetical protein